MQIVKRLIARFTLTLAMATTVLSLAITPAFAGGPIVYRQAGNHWSPMSFAPTYNVSRLTWLAPGERFNMICWTDHVWYNGNYGSYRWYYGQSFDHGYGYVHSSYVYYQWNVRRC